MVGKIALMRRGVIPYSQKIVHAAAAGAAGAVVFNSAPGIMFATLGSMGAIPAVSLGGDEGAVLLGRFPINGSLRHPARSLLRPAPVRSSLHGFRLLDRVVPD